MEVGESIRQGDVLLIKRGGLPREYQKVEVDRCVIALGEACDVSVLSLEAQLWWHGHKIADTVRLEKEGRTQLLEEKKRQALAKLTDDEKSVLGIK